MKKIIIIVFSIAIFGCTDLLHEESKENYTLQTFYQSVGQLEIGVNGMLWTLTRICQATDWIAYTEGGPGYLAYPVEGGRAHDFLSLSVTNTHSWVNWEGIWYWFYQGIEQANVAIAKIDEIPLETAADAEKIIALKGEVYFMRAYFFFNLVQLFGEELPLKTEPTYNLAESAIPPAGKGDIFTQIENDLKIAIENLPDKSYLENGSRPYKALAQAFLAKLYLRRGHLANNSTDFDEAAKMAASVITSDKVGLYENINVKALDADLQASSLYPSLDALHSITLERGKERMFVCNIAPGMRQASDFRVLEASLPIDLSFFSGKTTQAQVAVIGDGESKWNNRVIVPVEEMLKIGEKYPWDNRFKNRGWLYTSHVNEAGDSIVIGENVPKISAGLYRYFDSNAIYHGAEWGNRSAALDYGLIRYPDAIFDYAEAVAMGGSIVNGVDPIFHLNKVRNRAGEGNVVPQLSGEITLDMVVEERFRETVYEGHTLFDISRTKRAVELDTDGSISIKSFNQFQRPVFRTTNQLISPANSIPETLSEDDFYLPIPQDELNNNPYLQGN